MKQKASLTLMELLVMVLVFALATAVCLRCFGSAALLHRETALRDRAVLLAQNAAEAVKATGDPDAAAALMAQLPEEEGLRLDIQKQPSGIPGLGQALVEVHGEDALLFHLTVCWQEVAE